jgi:hypothetical protein
VSRILVRLEEMRPRPLSPPRAKASLANRLGRVADNVRQIATRLGTRPYRVWLHWIRWSGAERGEGFACSIAKVEILPTPKVDTLDSVSFSIFHAGTIPSGSVRVSEISVQYFNEDHLRGLLIPDLEWTEAHGPLPAVSDRAGTNGGTICQPFEFFWEVVEDGRNNRAPEKKAFRLLSNPMLQSERAQWTAMLERISPDELRFGESPFEDSEPAK